MNRFVNWELHQNTDSFEGSPLNYYRKDFVQYIMQ